MHLFAYHRYLLAGLFAVTMGRLAWAGAPAAQPGQPVFAADPAFDRYVDRNLLAQAWVDKNASLLTDLGLQLAEGERVLFRAHASISADQLLGMAARVAAEKKDLKTLARLNKALGALKKDELSAEVAAAQKLAMVSRGADPAAAISVDNLSPAAFLLVRDTLDSISSAKLAGDGETLDIIIQLTPQLTRVPEAQRKFLIKSATEARASLTVPDAATDALNRLLDAPNRRAPALESTTLGVAYTPMHKGLRVTGSLQNRSLTLGKGAKLSKGDLILRVGNRACYGNATNLDLLVDVATKAGNRELLVYEPKTRQVRTYELPGVESPIRAKAEEGKTKDR